MGGFGGDSVSFEDLLFDFEDQVLAVRKEANKVDHRSEIFGPGGVLGIGLLDKFKTCPNHML